MLKKKQFEYTKQPCLLLGFYLSYYGYVFLIYSLLQL